MGSWAAENGLKAEADKLLDRARRILTEYPDGPWLWAADLAKHMGRGEEAKKIEDRLLKEKRLPRNR